MSKKQDLLEKVDSLTNDTHVCRVDFYNHVSDGTLLVGVRADFLYSDGTEAPAINPSANLGFNGATSLFSQNKCVRRIDIVMTARRPSGNDEVFTANSGNAPAGRCFVHDGYGLEPQRTVSEAIDKKVKDKPLFVVSEATKVGNG